MTIKFFSGNKLTVFAVLILLVFSSCSRVHFDAAMPQKAHVLKVVDENLLGKYYSTDSLIVNKEKNPTYNLKYYPLVYKTMDSTCIVAVDLVIEKRIVFVSWSAFNYYDLAKVDTFKIAGADRGSKSSIKDGYLCREQSGSDTIFDMDEGDLVKYFNGKYYFNHRIEKNDWEVYQLELSSNKKLSFGVTNEADERTIEKSIPISLKMFNSSVHMNDNQFKAFVLEGGFRERHTFQK